MFNSAKQRLLDFIQFQVELNVGITAKGIWRLDLTATNDIVEPAQEIERTNAIGFWHEDYEPSKYVNKE